MVAVYFGRFTIDTDEATIQEKLRNHTSLYSDMIPERWKQLSDDDKERFGQAIFLRTSRFKRNDREISFSVEWDDIDSRSFRGEEYFVGETSYAKAVISRAKATLRFMLTGPAVGTWGAAPRVGRILFSRRGGIAPIEISSDVLKKVLKEDSQSERFMWWSDVEDGVDGALRGVLPRGGRYRSGFDSDGKPYFARFDSRSKGCVISISCKRGYVASYQLTEDEIMAYFDATIAPKLPVGQ